MTSPAPLRPSSGPADAGGASLTIVAWADAVVDSLGYDPRSAYVEQFWLGLVGPTGTWLVRRLASRFDEEPDGFTLDPHDVARSIGVGGRGRTSPFTRALERLCRFGLARRLDATTIAVRRRVPPLSRLQVQRLPQHLQAAHQQWLEAQLRRDSPARLATHGTRLARSLLAVGLPAGEVEDQLRRWDFPEPVRRRVLAEALEGPGDAPDPEAA